VQYKFFQLCAPATAWTGKANPVYSVVVLTDASVGNNLSASYQTVGSDYVNSVVDATSLLDTMSKDDRPVAWPNVENLPDSFPTDQHFLPLNKTTEWEFLVAGFNEVRTALILGDQVRKDQVLQVLESMMSATNALAQALLSPTSAFGQHVNQTGNVHGLTPADFNLDKVANKPVASDLGALQGAAERYLLASQAALLVRNAINGGMDAHILTPNAHGLTAGDIGLDKVMNYGVATIQDVNNPDASNPKYVTTDVAGQWLQQFLINTRSTVDQAFANVNSQITVKGQEIDSIRQSVASLTDQVLTSTLQAVTTLALANESNQLAAQVKSEVDSSAQTALQILRAYNADAVQAANLAGYAKGKSEGA
jgi:hypothetical protein